MRAAVKRPFPATLTRQCPPGRLELQLIFEEALSPDQKAGWQDVLKTFIDAAQCGALSGHGIAPARSGCVLAREEIQGRQAFWQLTQAALDAGACTVLLNLCHWGHLNIGGLQQVLLDWERCPEEADASPMVFPPAWPQLSFALQEYELAGQVIAIDIEFRDPQPAGVREHINESIGHWFKAANWGGYADEHFPLPGSTIVIAAPQPMTTDALGISWYIEACHCSDRVFDGLVNCLERISTMQAPIRQVTIGE